jgi:predicted nucleic acid-binding protein
MAIVFVDTNIVIEYLKDRNNESIIKFVDSFDTVYINDVVIMELYQGAREILDRYTLSHNTKIMDALIASTVIMYNIDLYTFNKKDFKYLKQIKLID